jgi:hypothetical protein
MPYSCRVNWQHFLQMAQISEHRIADWISSIGFDRNLSEKLLTGFLKTELLFASVDFTIQLT